MNKYEYWLSEEGLLRIRGWARDGYTDAELAREMGIARNTLFKWRKKFPKLDKTLKSSKEIPDRKVEETLYDKALDGDITAIIFWLKNRNPERWRNYVERNTKKDDAEQQARIDKLTLENEKLRAEIDKIKGTGQAFTDDGFIEALLGTAADDWESGSDEV